MVLKGHSVFKDGISNKKIHFNENELLQKSEISLWLDSYDDLYSDFDPRPNSLRALSQDFLDESKRAVRYSKNNEFQLNLLIDEKLRDLKEEKIISERLHEHLQKHYKLQKKERQRIMRKGILFVIIGVCLLFLATYLLVNYGDLSYYMAFLLIVLEPAGWFFAWEGLDLAIFTSKDESPDYDFYKKMLKCEIKFDSY